MTGTAGEPYPERELPPEGQDAEVGYPRDIGQNQMQFVKAINEVTSKDILLYSLIGT